MTAITSRPAVRDLAVCLAYTAVAGWLLAGLWADPTARHLALNPGDQILFEWHLAHDTRLFTGDFRLVTDRLNAPDGVNLMTNTSIIALGALLTPVTLAFGAPTTFALIVTGNLAATAAGWYLLYARGLKATRPVAALGGALCGFAPAMLSQSLAHLHMTAQWLVPAIVWCVIVMARAADTKRLLLASAGLAALVTVQVFIGEEVLALAFITLVLFSLAWAVGHGTVLRRMLPRFAAGLAVAAVLSGVALAYPLWVQFAGRQHIPNGPFSADYFSNDLVSFVATSPLSLGGPDPLTPNLAWQAPNPTEANTFLGWPLLIVTVAAAAWLRRHRTAVALAITGTAMALLSLGPSLVVGGERTEHRGPYGALLEGLPVVDHALPTRFANVLPPLIATLLVLAAARVTAAGVSVSQRRWALLLAVVALAPIAPKPLATAARPPVPTFITGGHWRTCVPPGGVLVPVPLPGPSTPDTMRWAAAANAAFAIPEGYFIGPYGDHGRASVGVHQQLTSHLLAKVAETGERPAIDDAARERFRADVRHWRASCVALARGPHHDAVRATLEQLAGPGTLVADTWTWRL